MSYSHHYGLREKERDYNGKFGRTGTLGKKIIILKFDMNNIR